MSGPAHTTRLAAADRRLLARLAAFAQLARLPFLFGGVIYNLLGAALAWYGGVLPHWGALLLSQVCITSAQLMTHGTNDYFDQAADRAHPHAPRWSGGSRALVNGDLPASWALAAVAVAGGAAIVAGLALGLLAAPAALAALVGVLLAWSYSGPPLRLHSSGAGEVAGALLLAEVTPLVAYLAQGGAAPLGAALSLAPLVSLQVAMLIAVSLPDLEGDHAVGKRTLAVRIGGARAGRWAAVATLAPYTLALYALSLRAAHAQAPDAGGAPWVIVAAVAMWAPLAAWQAWRLWRGHGLATTTWDSVAFGSIALVMGSATTAALVLLATARPA